MPVNSISLKDIVGDLTPEQAFDQIARVYSLKTQQKEFVKIFVEKYATDPKKRSKAYLEAGYLADQRDLIEDSANRSDEALRARKNLAVCVHTIKKNPKVSNAIKEYEKIHQQKRKLEIEDDVYRFTQIRATYDIRKLADVVVGNSPEEIAEKIRALDEETAACIDGFDFKYHGKDADRFSATFKFADRDKSIAMLTKLTGMITDKKEVHHTGEQMPTINISVLSDNDQKSTPRKVN